MNYLMCCVLFPIQLNVEQAHMILLLDLPEIVIV